ncbi:MAG: GNAT family N-acetyltransferase [Fluviicola sp.]|nr:GNAT family N-acetyltransferase [Fluviicola sp.]MBP6271277.1 GNAT family N-acetyltransferase [Fluviicola sp.]
MEIRSAQSGDEVKIMELIHALADYEKAPNEVINTAANLHNDLFEKKICHAIVAELKGEIVGFALYYFAYSTWKGQCLYLEDLFVQPRLRQHGIGNQLFDHIVSIAKKSKVKRMDWQVLAWNEPALEFYKKQGALLDDEWVNGRLFF